jgi:hypothetical protein
MTLTKDVPLTADMSVAPEIARLAEAARLVPVQPAVPAAPGPDPLGGHTGNPLTVGTLARRLRAIASTPERWWALVCFEPDRSVTVTVEESAAYQVWLVILPPGDAAQSCDCDVATMIAGEVTEGEVTEGAPADAVLRAGRVRVHGRPHVLRGLGTGYSISLHARAHRLSIKR